MRRMNDWEVRIYSHQGWVRLIAHPTPQRKNVDTEQEHLLSWRQCVDCVKRMNGWETRACSHREWAKLIGHPTP